MDFELDLTTADIRLIREALHAYTLKTVQDRPGFDLMATNEQARKLGNALVKREHEIGQLLMRLPRVKGV